MSAGEGGTLEKLWDQKPRGVAADTVWARSPPGKGPAAGTPAALYLRVLQLGLQSGEVLGELAGLAVRLGEKTCHVVQLDLHRDGRDRGP